jgi:hypothetical protein
MTILAQPTRKLMNRHLRLEFLEKAGPRIVGLYADGSSQNLLAELPYLEPLITPYGPYHFHGGHRLWHSPEAFPRTYIPDNEGLTIRESSQAVILTGQAEPVTGIQKSIEISIPLDRPTVVLTHRLINHGLWPVELAAWAITQLPLGGMAIFPQQVGPLDATGLLPNRQLVLWPYSRWQDKRLVLNDDYIIMRANPDLPPLKIGYFNRSGWIGYLRNKVLLVKRIEVKADLRHADINCNIESYCNNAFIELETLGPITVLDPGQSTAHVETWEIYTGVDISNNIQGVKEMVKSLRL